MILFLIDLSIRGDRIREAKDVQSEVVTSFAKPKAALASTTPLSVANIIPIVQGNQKMTAINTIPVFIIA
jgi:hypothetical protein